MPDVGRPRGGHLSRPTPELTENHLDHLGLSNK